MPTIVTDTFTDTNGVALGSHTGELGATWTAMAGNAATPTIQTNRLDAGTGSSNAFWYASGTPTSPDYTVTAEVIGGSDFSGNPAGPGARCSASAQTGYFAILFGGTLSIYRYLNGGITALAASSSSIGLTAGVKYTITIDVSSTAIAARMQRSSDSQWLTSSNTWQSDQVNALSVTNSDITAAGRPGFWLGQSSTRHVFDAFSANEPTGAATQLTLSGPSTGESGQPSANFTAGANGTISGTVTVTPSDSSGGGTFNPTSVAISAGTPTATFTYTPSSIGAKTISVNNNGGLSNPSGITYTATTPTTKYARVDATDPILGQNIMVLVPNSNSAVPYNAANPTRVILYAHGAGESQTALVADSLKAATVDALLNAGYILAGSNEYGTNWGNQNGIDSLVALEKYVRDNYNVAGVAIWGQSMGGLSGLSAISQGKFRALGFLGTYPVCNLANLYALGAYTSGIAAAHSITGSGTGTYANRTRGYDPALGWGTSWRHVPMRFYASSGDTTVPKAANADTLAAIAVGSTTEATVVACTGDHGDPSHFQPSDTVSFFNRCFSNPVAASGQLGSGGGAGTVFGLGFGGLGLTADGKLAVGIA